MHPTSPTPSRALTKLDHAGRLREQLKVVVALSNAGATLLERRAQTQALSVLKESMNALNDFYMLEEGEHPQVAAINKNDVQLQWAAKHLAASCTPPGLLVSSRFEFSLDDPNFLAMKNWLQSPSPACLMHPIHISDLDCSHDCAVGNTDLICAVVLFNLSLAYVFLSDSASESGESVVMLHASQELQNQALTILSRALQQSETQDAVRMAVILFLSCLVLDCLSNVSAKIGAHAAAEKYAASFMNVNIEASKILQFIQTVLGVSFDSECAAAA
jgi:hypothetical protein